MRKNSHTEGLWRPRQGAIKKNRTSYTGNPSSLKVLLRQQLQFIMYRLATWQVLTVLLIITILFGIFCYYWWRELRWKYIVIHHTASDTGDMEFYRKQHARKWGDLAYHIIINNGSNNTTPGQIEYSPRWKKRQHHFSTKKSYLNYFGIAIALVGNFEKHAISPLQKEALLQLLLVLSKRYSIRPENVIGHREIQNTKCPGAHVSMKEIRLWLKEKL